MEYAKQTNEKIYLRQAEILHGLLETLVPQVIEQQKPADRVLAAFFKRRRELGSRDRRFLSECFFSYFRWLGWTNKMDTISNPVEKAALSRMLDGAEIHPALVPFVKVDATETSRLHYSDLFPAGFEKHISIPAGREHDFYESLQRRPPVWLRLRSEKFEAVLSAAGIQFRQHPVLHNAIALDAGVSLAALGAGGQYSVQDINSQAVVEIAAPESGSDWWDACAGTGGKSLQLADKIGGAGKVLSTDVRQSALQECKKRARAAGIKNIRTQLHNLAGERGGHSCLIKNGRQECLPHLFDGVLVDAPCSGWGTWNRNPDARWRSDLRDPAQKRNLQLRMLDRAAECVKPGGVLVFAVCTFTVAETGEVVAGFLKDHPEFSLAPFINPLTGEQTNGTLQLWPYDGPGSGMFIAKFVKQETHS
ncbi:MAG: RsmB/NOP family class I SAM-dependent RNA methyltransferase [Kiritimatiellales bacterium]